MAAAVAFAPIEEWGKRALGEEVWNREIANALPRAQIQKIWRCPVCQLSDFAQLGEKLA
jgi:hypothetical protein